MTLILTRSTWPLSVLVSSHWLCCYFLDSSFSCVIIIGNLTARHREVFRKNDLFVGMRLPEARELDPLEKRYPRVGAIVMDIIKVWHYCTDRTSSWCQYVSQCCLRLDPTERSSCTQLLQHKYFTHDGFAEKFTVELRQKVQKEYEDNPLLKTLGITIHGSLHDYLHQPAHKEAGEKLLHRETSTIQAQMSTRDHLTSTNEAAATGLVVANGIAYSHAST